MALEYQWQLLFRQVHPNNGRLMFNALMQLFMLQFHKMENHLIL
jgi:hypothetical protein